MQEVTCRLLRLPPFKPVAAKILRLDSDASASLSKVMQLIRSDPALTSEVLHLANSPLFGLKSEVHSVEHAAALVGLDRIKMLVMRVASEAFLGRDIHEPVIQHCWMHSIVSAEVAEQLAPIFIISKDRGSIVGLLHDIGRVGLLKAFAREYGPLVTAQYGTTEQCLTAERVLFQLDHCRTGAILTRTWGFPDYFSDIANTHHDRVLVDRDLAGLARLSCRLAACIGFPGTITAEANYEEELLRWPQEIRSRLVGKERLLRDSVKKKLDLLRV